MHKKIPLILLATATLLSACNNKIVDEAEKVESQKKEQEYMQEELEAKQLEILEENEITLDEVLEDIDKEKETKKTLDIEKVEEKEEFHDGEEFAQYVSSVLFDYFTGEISAEDYYNFVTKHGSLKHVKDLDTDMKDLMVKSFADIQKLFLEQDLAIKKYKVSELTLDEAGIYGYFYRTLITEEGTELNYVTTIVNEGQNWKYESDVLSHGYKENTKEEG